MITRRDVLKLTPVALLSGCASLTEIGEGGQLDPALLSFMVESAGMGVGIVVAGAGPEIDTILRNVYGVATEGKLDVLSINKLIGTMISGEDLVTKMLANRILGLVELFGGSISNNLVVNLGELDPKLMKALGDGYIAGYDMMRLEATRRSVV